jgi:hypothetical protein
LRYRKLGLRDDFRKVKSRWSCAYSGNAIPGNGVPKDRKLVFLVGMIVAPGPILLLLAGFAFLEITMVAVSFDLPPLIVDALVGVPHMVVLVARVVDAIGSTCSTTVDQQRREKRESQQNGRAAFVYE